MLRSWSVIMREAFHVWVRSRKPDMAIAGAQEIQLYWAKWYLFSSLSLTIFTVVYLLKRNPHTGKRHSDVLGKFIQNCDKVRVVKGSGFTCLEDVVVYVKDLKRDGREEELAALTKRLEIPVRVKSSSVSQDACNGNSLEI